MRGVYTLIVWVADDLVVRTQGARFALQKGLYLYVGSAMGPHTRSLETRISRHLKKRKKRFWHIDYLLNSGKAKVGGVVYSRSRRRFECGLALSVERRLNRVVPLNGFGSSDCACRAHLFLLTYETKFQDVLRKLSRVYRAIGLSPSVMPIRS